MPRSVPTEEWGRQVNGVSTPNASRNVRISRMSNGLVRIGILQGLGPRASTRKVIAFADLTEEMAQEISNAMEHAIFMDDGKVTPDDSGSNDNQSFMDMTVSELKNIAKAKGLEGIGRLNKAALVSAIQGA